MARFALFTNGVRVETLDELKENFNIKDMLENYRNKALHRWLSENGFANELVKIEKLNPNVTELLLTKRLVTIFSLSDEQSKRAYQQEEARRQKELHDSEARKEETPLLPEKHFIDIQQMELVYEDCVNVSLLTDDQVFLKWEDGVDRDFQPRSGTDNQVFLKREDGIDRDFQPRSGTDNQVFLDWVDGDYKIIPDHTGKIFINYLDSIYTSSNGLIWNRIYEIDDLLNDLPKTGITRIEQIKCIDDKIVIVLCNSDYFIASNTSKSAWKVFKTRTGEYVINVASRAGNLVPLTRTKCRGDHVKDKSFPLESTNDIEQIEYFKNQFVAIGRWNRYVGKSNYSIYNTSDLDIFFPVTPEESETHKAETVKFFSFENIVFACAFSDSKECACKMFYSLDGAHWTLSPIFAREIFQHNSMYVAFDRVPECEWKYCEARYIVTKMFISADGIEWKEITLPRVCGICPCEKKLLFAVHNLPKREIEYVYGRVIERVIDNNQSKTVPLEKSNESGRKKRFFDLNRINKIFIQNKE